jgi:hypothetical protein
MGGFAADFRGSQIAQPRHTPKVRRKRRQGPEFAARLKKRDILPSAMRIPVFWELPFRNYIFHRIHGKPA